MTMATGAALIAALVGAFIAIVLGRNLTRSIAAGFSSIAFLGLALALAGSGFLGLVVVILSALMLGSIQLFGWMLVDIDRDHIPPTDRPTALARGIAFLLLGVGLALLFWNLLGTGEFAVEGRSVAELGRVTQSGEEVPAGMTGLGSVFFGPMRDLVTLLGFAIAAGLLATLLLLQEEKGKS